jgi:hypothetical protein
MFVLLVAAAKILAAKAGSSIDPGCLSCFALLVLPATSVAIAEAGNPYWRGRLSTVDLLVLTSLAKLLLKKQTFFAFYKTTHPNGEVNCT